MKTNVRKALIETLKTRSKNIAPSDRQLIELFVKTVTELEALPDPGDNAPDANLTKMLEAIWARLEAISNGLQQLLKANEV